MMAEITKSSLWGEKREKQEPKDLNPLKIWSFSCYCSVAKSCPTLRPHELQHTRLPCPSLSPGVCSNSCPLSRWCHRTISSSVTPFSSCPQSFPASGKDWSFQMSQFFTSSGQIIGVSPRQSFKRQRHHFANKGPFSQRYGFFSSRVQMWVGS